MPEANRDPLDARYDLLEEGFLTAMAQTMAAGEKTYGVDNWKKGLPHGKGALNHALYHLLQASKGGPDALMHLAHAGCNIMFLFWFEEAANVRGQ